MHLGISESGPNSSYITYFPNPVELREARNLWLLSWGCCGRDRVVGAIGSAGLQRRETSVSEEADVNEVSVRSTPRPMPTGQRNRGIELLPPFESRHYSHK